jgi:uncharacterized protein YbjT (DUF2867 family)
LIRQGDVRISAHGYNELAADGILAREVFDGTRAAVVVEDYRSIQRGHAACATAADVAQVVAAVLADPGPHLGRTYELIGPRSQDMHGVAKEYSDALNREVTYSDIPPRIGNAN